MSLALGEFYKEMLHNIQKPQQDLKDNVVSERDSKEEEDQKEDNDSFNTQSGCTEASGAQPLPQRPNSAKMTPGLLQQVINLENQETDQNLR